MMSRGRKKFCLSKRIEEYHYMESESSEESNSEEDHSSIFRLFHQKSLKLKKKLEIEQKFEDEFQKNFAHQSQFSLQSNDNFSSVSEEDESLSTLVRKSTRSSTSNCSTNKQLYSSTPRISVSALRPINKLALSRIDRTQTLAGHSFESPKRSSSNRNNEKSYQESFVQQNNTRKSSSNNKTRRQSAIPFERLQTLANESPFMSPMSPSPALRGRRNAQHPISTIMSTFKTYCEINTQTTPELEHNYPHLTIDSQATSGDKSDSSTSVISFSQALVDEPEDIYMCAEPRSVARLDEESHNEEPILSSSSKKQSSVSKKLTRSARNLANESLSFDPPAQSTRRSTIIPSSFGSSQNLSKTSNRSSRSKATRSAIVTGSEDSELSKKSISVKSSKNLSLADDHASSSWKSMKSSNPSRRSKSLLDTSEMVKSNSKSQKQLHCQSSRIDNRSSSSKKRTQSSSTIMSKLDSTNAKPSSEIMSNYSMETNEAFNSVDTKKANSEIISTADDSSFKPTSQIFSNCSTQADDMPTSSERCKTRSEIISNAGDSRTKSTSVLSSKWSTKTNDLSNSVKSRKNRSEILSNAGDITTRSTSRILSNYPAETNDTSSSVEDKKNSSEILSRANEPSTHTHLEMSSDFSNEQDDTLTPADGEQNRSEIISNAGDSSAKPTSEIFTSYSTQTDDMPTSSESRKTRSEIISNAGDSRAKSLSEIFSNCPSQTDDSLTPVEDEKSCSEIISNAQDLSAQPNSEIFSSCSDQTCDSLSPVKSEKTKNSTRSSIPDQSFDREMEEDSDDLQNKSIQSRIDDDSTEERDQQECSHQSIESNDESNNKETNNKSSFISIVNESASKATSELENTSFSRIEPNISAISVSFEPSVDHSNNHSNFDVDDRQEVTFEDGDQESEFKVPQLPAVQLKGRQAAKSTIVKPQPKFYETMINKTPTIIYPNEGDLASDEDDQDCPKRRSSRIRIRPLEYWRNQKLKYKLDSETKCFTIEGVEKGFKPENPFSKKYTRLAMQEQNRMPSNKRKLKGKKTKLRKIKEERDESQSDDTETSSSDTESSSSEEEREPAKRVRYALDVEQSIHQDVNESALVTSERIKREAVEFYSKSELVWTPSRQSSGVHIALMNRKKSSKTGTQASGFIKMEGFAEKPRQVSSDYVTKYVIMFGAVSVQIADKPTVFLKVMDSFTVDKHTNYSINNLREDESLLYFDVCRSN